MLKAVCVINYYEVEYLKFDEAGDLIQTNKSVQSTISDGKIKDKKGYLTLSELSEITGLAHQTIYNMNRKGIFVEGVHYHKPNGGKLLFKWSTMLEWIDASKPISPNNNHTTNKPISDNEQSHQSSVKIVDTPPTNKDYVNI